MVFLLPLEQHFIFQPSTLEVDRWTVLKLQKSLLATQTRKWPRTEREADLEGAEREVVGLRRRFVCPRVICPPTAERGRRQTKRERERVVVASS